MTGKRVGSRSGETDVVSAPALPRISLAIGAAFALHIAMVASASAPGRASTLTAAAKAMTVRQIAFESLAPQAGRTANDERDAEPAATVAPAPAMAPVPIAEPAASRRSGAAAIASTEPALSPSTNVPARVAAAGTASSGSATALPPAPDYLLGAALDPGPQPIGEIEPEYPDSAYLQEGVVVIRVLISDAGHVDNVAVARSNPSGLFEEAAIEAFAKAKFSPGRAAGVAVKSQITVEVHFLPINRGSRISGRTY